MVNATHQLDRQLVEADASSAKKAPILVAATPTERGQRAVALAALLANASGAPLTAFSILEAGRFKKDGGAALDALCASLEGVLEEGCPPCAAHVASFPEHYTDEEYGRAVCVVDAATACNASMIVIGHHALGRGRKKLGATMTEKLLQHAPCPVLIAGQTPPHGPKRVMVAVDFSPIALEALETAVRLFPDAKITALHVANQVDKAPSRDSAGGLHSLENLVRAAVHEVVGSDGTTDHITARVVTGAPGQALAEAVDEERPDVLVLGTKGRTGLARLVLGSVAARFIDEPPCDLLVLKSR